MVKAQYAHRVLLAEVISVILIRVDQIHPIPHHWEQIIRQSVFLFSVANTKRTKTGGGRHPTRLTAGWLSDDDMVGTPSRPRATRLGV